MSWARQSVSRIRGMEHGRRRSVVSVSRRLTVLQKSSEPASELGRRPDFFPKASNIRGAAPGWSLARCARVSPIAICFLLLLAPAVTFAQSPRSGADALARQASEALQEKRFGDALAAFTEAVGIRPRDAELWTGKGMTEFLLGQNEHAETSLVRAVAV